MKKDTHVFWSFVAAPDRPVLVVELVSKGLVLVLAQTVDVLGGKFGGNLAMKVIVDHRS